MKIFKNIVDSITEPLSSSLWLNNGFLKYYSNGTWNQIGLEEVQSKNKELPTFSLDENDYAENYRLATSIGVHSVQDVNVVGTLYGTTYNTVGHYHAGEITVFNGSEYIIFDVNFAETDENFTQGEITISGRHDVSTAVSAVHLQVGDDAVIKSLNRENIGMGGEFFVTMAYGNGTGNFHGSEGGNATIITANGSLIKYSISSDGEVTKTGEFTPTYE